MSNSHADATKASDKLGALEAKRRELEIHEKIWALRKSILDEKIAFWSSKGVGILLSLSGGAEVLDPNLLPIDFSNPSTVLGGGLALLIGKRVVDELGKVFDALRKG